MEWLLNDRGNAESSEDATDCTLMQISFGVQYIVNSELHQT